MSPDKTVIRKRTLIAKANRNMFVWIAVASVIVSVSIVGSIILVQRIMHMERVISAKSNTQNILVDNNKVVPDLENNVRALNSNQALIDSKAKPTDEAVQVVLDALPAEANSLAIGASLQKVLLANVSGVTIDSITVQPVVGVEALTEGSYVTVSEGTLSMPSISFMFSVRGQLTGLIEVLNRLEKSIRVFDTTKVKIESQGADQVMTVEGVAYYQPTVTIELNKKTVN